MANGSTKRIQRKTQLVWKTEHATNAPIIHPTTDGAINCSIYIHMSPGKTYQGTKNGLGRRVGSWVESMQHCVLCNGARKIKAWVKNEFAADGKGSKP